jgi:hypothetical protein
VVKNSASDMIVVAYERFVMNGGEKMLLVFAVA